MKYLLIILLSVSFVNASMLLDSNTLCIEDYWTQNGKFYYVRSSDLATVSVNSNDMVSTVFQNFTYDSATDKCTPDGINSLGLTTEHYNFLLALCGLFFGFTFMWFTVEAFTKVGGRR